MIENIQPYSTVNYQDFMWVAEYHDGTLLSEFDLDTGNKNSYYNIEKYKLSKFGLVGCGYKFFFETYNGVFNIAHRNIEVSYEIDGKEIKLTGQPIIYNDIIQYKDAVSSFNPFGNNNDEVNQEITQHNFGYKTKININDMEINFRAICKVPYDKPVHLELRMVSNKNMNGRIIIRNNGVVVDTIEAPLNANVNGMLNWIVK